jgi:hypothetical protein
MGRRYGEEFKQEAARSSSTAGRVIVSSPRSWAAALMIDNSGCRRLGMRRRRWLARRARCPGPRDGITGSFVKSARSCEQPDLNAGSIGRFHRILARYDNTDAVFRALQTYTELP